MDKRVLFISTILLITVSLFAQDNGEMQFQFDTIASVKTTSVKDQHRSGTCWSYAATSFIETELLRKKQGRFDLSEMFFVKYAYEDKAKNYVRLHGKANFSPGGQAHDVIDVVKNQGMVPEENYDGMIPGQTQPNHSELDKVLKGYVNGVLAAKGRGNTIVWHDGLRAVLDIYLGKVPETFKHNGTAYNPKSFVEAVEFNPDNYVELTSYNHHEFYEAFRLEIPDNWNYAKYYNLPLNELMTVMENALDAGYSICWDGDVSDKFFDHKAAIAMVPVNEDIKTDELTSNTPERKIDQQERQKAFATFKATDDHLMHITAIIKDDNDNKYYVTKNSWNTDSNDNGGYLNMSENYVRLNTVAIMVHKDAIPENIKLKLNL